MACKEKKTTIENTSSKHKNTVSEEATPITPNFKV